MKHGLNTDEPQSRRDAEMGEGWKSCRTGATVKRGTYRLSRGFCRIRVGFYRLITGFSRLWIGFSRVFPPFPASSRINFFARNESSRIMGRGMIGRGMAKWSLERRWVGSGFKRAERRKRSRICPRKSLVTRFNPVQPALTRMNFFDQAGLGSNMRRGETTETQRHGGKRGKAECGIMREKLRIFPRFSAIFRTE